MRYLPVAAVVAIALLAGTTPATRAANIEAVGGPGGGPAQYLCNDDERLVGIGARYGSWLDWVGPICAPINGDSGWGNAPRGTVWIPEKSKSIFEEIGATWVSFLPWNLPGTVKGWVGPQVVVGTRVPGMGGEGGHLVTFAVCPENFFVFGFDTIVLGGKNFVARVTLHCRNLQTQEESWVALPQPPASSLPYYTITGRTCPAGEMASGIHGRSGIFVDAFGLTCRPTASKAFCQGYANQAASQVQQAANLNCGFGGARWTPNASDHLGWCMSLAGNEAAPNSESAARANDLATCKASRPLTIGAKDLSVLKVKGAGLLVPKLKGGTLEAMTPPPEPVAPVEPTSYVLTCIGGGQMTGRLDGTRAIVDFAPGREGSAAAAPNPGECTWYDRGFRPGEPLTLALKDPLQTGEAQSLLEAARPGGSFQLRVYNNGEGLMVVTGVDQITPVPAAGIAMKKKLDQVVDGGAQIAPEPLPDVMTEKKRDMVEIQDLDLAPVPGVKKKKKIALAALEEQVAPLPGVTAKKKVGRLATVNGDVDIYDIPDGVGNVIGMLRQGSQVQLLLCREDQWCQVRLPEGAVWVWGEFLDR